MINLEQIKLLEEKVANAVDYVERVSLENAIMAEKETELLKKAAEMQAVLEANKKRIDELEVLIMRFKDEQGQIEDGILAALDRLSRFEEAMETSLIGKPAGRKAKASGTFAVKTPEKNISGGQDICFEIPQPALAGNAHAETVAASAVTDVIDPLEAMLEEELLADIDDRLAEGKTGSLKELEIF